MYNGFIKRSDVVMGLPTKIKLGEANEIFTSLGDGYYISRLGKMVKVQFKEDGSIEKVEEIFKPSVKEG